MQEWESLAAMSGIFLTRIFPAILADLQPVTLHSSNSSGSHLGSHCLGFTIFLAPSAHGHDFSV